MKPILILCLAILAAAPFAQVDPGRVVATVNGEEIRGGEYYRRMEFLRGVGRRVGNSIAEAAPGFLTLDALINERLVLQLAKNKGVSVTDAEVASEMQQMQQDDPTMLQNWLASGQTRPELEHQVRLDLIRFKLATFGVTITDLEVDKFYKDNPSRFTTLRSVQIRVIAVDTEVAKSAVDASLAGGKKFADVATERSIDLTKSSGGALGRPALAMLPKPVQDALAAIKIGQITAWVQTESVWVKFSLEDVIPERLLPLDAKLRLQVRRQLMIDKGNVRNDVAKEIGELRRRATIDIKEKAFADTFNRLLSAAGGG